MKNYPELFDETYDMFFEQYERQRRNKKLLRKVIIFASSLLLSFAVFIVVAWSVQVEEKSIMDAIILCIQTPLMWGLGIVIGIGIVISGVYDQWNSPKSNIYENKATEFAITIYLDDIIAALSSRFTLSQDFKDKLKKAMTNLCWYDDKFASGIEFDEDFFGETITMAGEDFYLVGVENTKTGFLFECKKVITKDQFETVEFFLTVPKK